MRINGLCAGSWIHYLPDIVVLAFFIVMIIVSARRGFVGCMLNIVSSVVAFILAASLASAVVDGTGGLFGLESVVIKSMTKTFAKVEGFGLDISQVGLEEALERGEVSAVLARLVMSTAGGKEHPPGTTLARLLGEATGSFAVLLVAGILLFILIKIGVRLLKKILSVVVNKIPLLGGVNRILGGLFGILYASLIVSGVLAILAVLPFEGISVFLSKSIFVSFLYENNVLVILLASFL